MEPTKVEHFKRKLIKRKGELEDLIDAIESEGLNYPLSDSISELSAYDNHPADLGDEVFERSKDMSLRENARSTIGDIDRALNAIKQGTYGICADCGKAISSDRLSVLPETTTCVSCSEKQREGDRTARPVEEKVMIPPFNLQSIQDNQEPADNQVIFDGEDTWQEVARFGSSDTPQDEPASEKYPNIWTDEGEDRGSVDNMDAIPYRRGEDGMIYEEGDKMG